MNAEKLKSEAEKIKNDIVRIRKYLHSHAEVGFEMPNTLRFVESELEKIGCTPIHCGKSGIVTLIGGKKPGKVFLLRADMDALPVREMSGENFASDNGCMHACGHDMHTAMLIGAARLLKSHEDEIDGTVKLMFQPAEEIFGGAADMLGDGALDDPCVNAAVMIHVMTNVPCETGTVIVSDPGVSAPAADYFEICVKGKGCHGSMPNMGIDPITAAAHIIIALQEIQARELAMSEHTALTVGTVSAGAAPNAIPDEAIIGGSLRTFDENLRICVKKRIADIAAGIAGAFRAKADTVFGSGCPSLLNDGELSGEAYCYVRELMGDGMAFTVGQLAAKEKSGKSGGLSKSSGSEDFAYISRRIPSIMLALAAGQTEKGYGYPQHHPMARFDNDALDVGIAVYAYTAMRWLESHASD